MIIIEQDLIIEIFKSIINDLSNLQEKYYFIQGLPKNITEYFKNPKDYKTVREDITRIYNHKLEDIINNNYLNTFKLTIREGNLVKDYLSLKKLRNLLDLSERIKQDYIIEQQIKEKMEEQEQPLPKKIKMKEKPIPLPDYNSEIVEKLLAEKIEEDFKNGLIEEPVASLRSSSGANLEIEIASANIESKQDIIIETENIEEILNTPLSEIQKSTQEKSSESKETILEEDDSKPIKKQEINKFIEIKDTPNLPPTQELPKEKPEGINYSQFGIKNSNPTPLEKIDIKSFLEKKDREN